MGGARPGSARGARARTRRRWLGGAAGAGLGGAALLAAAGCGAPAGGREEPGVGRAAQTGKVSWMATGAGARVALHERQVARFQEVTGNTVELVLHSTGPYEEKLFSLLAAGTAPDIFRLEGPFIPVLVAQGQLAVLDELIRRDRLDTADLFDKGLAMYRWQGKQYALPWLAYRVLFYNVDLLEKNGVPLPPVDWSDKTWNQAAFVAALKRLVPAGAPPQPGGTWGFGSPLSGQDAWVWSLGNGGDVLSEDDRRFTLDQPAAVEGLQYFADLINVHKAHPTPSQAREDATQGAFLSGRAAFYFGAVATAGQLAAAPFRADTAPIPWGRVGTPTTGGGHAWPMNKASAAPEVAWQLQRFLASKENDLMQVQSGEAPPFRKSTAGLKEWKERRPPLHPETMARGAEFLARRPMAPTWNRIDAALTQALTPVWEGQRAAREALQSVKPEVEALLAEGWRQVGPR